MAAFREALCLFKAGKGSRPEPLEGLAKILADAKYDYYRLKVTDQGWRAYVRIYKSGTGNMAEIFEGAFQVTCPL